MITRSELVVKGIIHVGRVIIVVADGLLACPIHWLAFKIWQKTSGKKLFELIHKCADNIEHEIALHEYRMNQWLDKHNEELESDLYVLTGMKKDEVI